MTYITRKSSTLRPESVMILHTACNTRVWEKTYNVNLESLKGGRKHLRHSEYTIYTDGSKKHEGTGGGFVAVSYTHLTLPTICSV